MTPQTYANRLLYICVPLKHRGVDFACSLSLNRLQAHIKERGGQLVIGYEPNGGIVLARNMGISRALSLPEMTDFLFLDADVSFRPEAVDGLVLSGLGFVAGPCPARGTDWEALYERFKAGQIHSPEEAALLSTTFFLRFPEGRFRRMAGRYIEATHVATSFLYLSRYALENLASESKLIKRVDYVTRKPELIYYVCHFETPEDLSTGFCDFIGEDFALCEKYRLLCGGKVYIDSECKLDHAGETVFSSMTIAEMTEKGKLSNG